MDRLTSSFLLLIVPVCECKSSLRNELFSPHLFQTYLLFFSFSPQMSCPRLFWKSLALEYCSPPRPSVWLVLSLGFHWALMEWWWAGCVSLQGRVWSGWHSFGGMMIRATTHPWGADNLQGYLQQPGIPQDHQCGHCRYCHLLLCSKSTLTQLQFSAVQ